MWDKERKTDNVWLSIADLPVDLYPTALDSKEYVSDIAAADLKVVPKGTLLVSFKLTLGRLAVAGRDLFTNEAIAALHDLRTDKIDQRFLFWYLSYFDWQAAAAGDEKVKGKTLNKAKLKVLRVIVPPLEEQRRIVAVLDEGFEGLMRARENTEANLASARELFSALVGKIFSRRDVEFSKLRLGSIVNRLTNGYVGPTRNIYVDEGVPYLLARHVKNNILTFDGKTYVSTEFNDKHKKSKLKEDDVLLVQSGHIGHSAVVPEEHEGHNCHAMIVITPKPEVLTGVYLSAVFNTPQMQSEFQRIRTGSTVPHLTCKMVKELEVTVPSKAMQARIVEEIAELRAQCSAHEVIANHKLADLKDLRQSLLQKAFAGDLT